MLELHNAKERGMNDWVELLAKADSRFKLLNVRTPRGSRLAVMEIGWLSDDVGSTSIGLSPALRHEQESGARLV